MTEELTPIEEPTSPSEPQPVCAISSVAQAINHVIEAASGLKDRLPNFSTLFPVLPPQHPITRYRDRISMQRQLARDIQEALSGIDPSAVFVSAPTQEALDALQDAIASAPESAQEALNALRTAAVITFQIDQVFEQPRADHIALRGQALRGVRAEGRANPSAPWEDLGEGRIRRYEMPDIVPRINIDTARMREVYQDIARQLRRMDLRILQDEPIQFEQQPAEQSTLKQCRGCKNFHGRRYGDELLVCAMHPYGYESGPCPDLE